MTGSNQFQNQYDSQIDKIKEKSAGSSHLAVDGIRCVLRPGRKYLKKIVNRKTRCCAGSPPHKKIVAIAVDQMCSHAASEAYVLPQPGLEPGTTGPNS